MTRQPRPIDDYALAAFITGKIPGKIREEIIDSLRSDEDARELLAMAYEALTAAHGPDEAMRQLGELETRRLEATRAENLKRVA